MWATQLEVSVDLGITQSAVYRLWQRFQDDGNMSRCPRVTILNEDQYLAVTAERNGWRTASDLSSVLFSHCYDSFKVDCTDVFHLLRLTVI
ncbi:uncharacterized protein TNCV_4759621 [Trichonephila clavipes]|nr:uncharacterized protein TNCV_4759621 [Trichonephila clavipes]